MKKGVSIILTAWKTQDYIEECLDSINKQQFFNKEKTNYEILLGIDGCEKTLEKINQIKHKYNNLKVFYFRENVGTYIVCNTLIMMAEYEYIYKFDTDDIMLPDTISTLYSYTKKEKADMVLAHCKRVHMNTNKTDKPSILGPGLIFIKTETFKKFGGFQPIRCGADTELYKRIQKFTKVKIIPNVCTISRIHNNNLTVKNDTGMKSDYRKSIQAFIDYELKMWIKSEKDAIINYIIAPCYNIETNEDILFENNISKSMYEKFMELSDNIKKQQTRNSNFYNYNTVTLNHTRYLKKRIQTSWTGYSKKPN